eukprot:7523120-Alexandrium_andersonii.AAC.1
MIDQRFRRGLTTEEKLRYTSLDNNAARRSFKQNWAAMVPSSLNLMMQDLTCCVVLRCARACARSCAILVIMFVLMLSLIHI